MGFSPEGSASINKGVGNPVEIAGKGSTAKKEISTLNEQMAMHEVMSNPLKGATDLEINLTDERWLSSDGWTKMQNIVQYGTKKTDKVNIHFVYNKITGIFDDFKIK